jgi:diacylglycerol kinase (ATP)
MATAESRTPIDGPAVAPRTQTAAVVYNPIKVEVDALKSAIAAEDAAGVWNTLWFETTADDPGQGQAREALAAGATIVIAAGGDGTVRAVAEVVKGTDAALALLPSGTGNLLARNLELTLDDLGHSIHTAFAGVDRAVDVAILDIRRLDNRVERYAFLVMAGVGLDAKIMSNTDDELKKKVGWLAYAQALAITLRDKSMLRVRYRFDEGHSRSARAQAVILGNCGSLPANILLLPDAVVDDGLLDIVVLKPESIRGWLQVVFKIFWENGVVKRTKLGRKLNGIDVAAVDYAQARKLEVRLGREHEIQLDGDPFGMAVGFRAHVEPGALRIRVPS